jgi:serine/threonine-protein kinase
MQTASMPEVNVRSSFDFLDVLQHSDILPAQRVEEIRTRVRAGTYPRDAFALAARLVKKEVLTAYQARRLLHGQAEGLSVGRYVLLDRIGRGAMGKVYKARHRLLGRTVALKFISRTYLKRPNALPRFLREMRLVGRLDHPHIVRALDAEELGSDPCIVMEYVPGLDLERLLLSRGPLPAEDVACYARHAALGLAHAHEQGVIHRDIKPSNLLLGEDGRVRILDLGLATLADDKDRDADVSPIVSHPGGAIGTADYMSPEQALAQDDLDGRSDLYSLGCVMYHLLTGSVPFPEESLSQCLAQRIEGRPVPLAERRPGLPAALIAIVDRLMANRREDRYAAATLAAEALRSLSLGGGASPPPRDAWSGPALPLTVASSGSISVETLAVGDPALSHSASFAPGAPPGRWVRLLTRLSEWPPWVALLAGSVVLVGTFGAGALFSQAIR